MNIITIMEYQKLMNYLGNIQNEPSKSRTRNRVEIKPVTKLNLKLQQ